MDKVKNIIEATPMLTKKIDVRSLNLLAYAAANTVIKAERAKNECIIKKQDINKRKGDWTFNKNRRINDLRADISKIPQMGNPRPSPKMKRNTTLMKIKYWIADERTSTSLETLR